MYRLTSPSITTTSRTYAQNRLEVAPTLGDVANQNISERNAIPPSTASSTFAVSALKSHDLATSQVTDTDVSIAPSAAMTSAVGAQPTNSAARTSARVRVWRRSVFVRHQKDSPSDVCCSQRLI